MTLSFAQIGLASISVGVMRSGGSVQHPGTELDEDLEQLAAGMEGGALPEAFALGRTPFPLPPIPPKWAPAHLAVLWRFWSEPVDFAVWHFCPQCNPEVDEKSAALLRLTRVNYLKPCCQWR